MKDNYISFYKEYFNLRDKVDLKVEFLENEHKKHITCSKGCDMCCIDYSIFPVEYYSILYELLSNKTETTNENSENDKCVFLKNHSCIIYSSRPFICRTHGIPLLYTDEEGEWVLSACELNFVDFDFAEFSIETTFPQDRINSKLYLLNKDFIAAFDKKSFNELDLIPIKQLQEDIELL